MSPTDLVLWALAILLATVILAAATGIIVSVIRTIKVTRERQK